MSDALQKEIEAANEKFVAAFSAQDADKIATMYCEDCTVLPPGSPAAKGRKEVAAVFDSIIKQGAVRLTLDIDEVGPFGATDICYERSKYTFYKENGDVLLAGRYVVVWKKVDNSWLIYIDCLSPL